MDQITITKVTNKYKLKKNYSKRFIKTKFNKSIHKCKNTINSYKQGSKCFKKN